MEGNIVQKVVKRSQSGNINFPLNGKKASYEVIKTDGIFNLENVEAICVDDPHTQTGSFFRNYTEHKSKSCRSKGYELLSIPFPIQFEDIPHTAISITSFSIMANSFQASIEIESICTNSFIVMIDCHDGIQYLEFNWLATIPHKSGIFIYTHHIDFSAFDEANTVQGYRILRKKAVHDTGIMNSGAAIGLSGFGFYNAQKVGPRFGVDLDSIQSNGYRMNFKLWDNIRLKFAKVFVIHYEKRSTTHNSLISGSIGN